MEKTIMWAFIVTNICSCISAYFWRVTPKEVRSYEGNIITLAALLMWATLSFTHEYYPELTYTCYIPSATFQSTIVGYILGVQLVTVYPDLKSIDALPLLVIAGVFMAALTMIVSFFLGNILRLLLA